MRRGYGPGRGQQQISLPILLLGMQIMRAGFDRIPPVTLVSLMGQVAIFLRLLPFKLPSIQEACVSPVSVWYYEDYQRLLLAPFFHASDWHLYYNMASFLWKGISLERRLGSPYFAYMIAVFSVLTSALMVGMGMGAEQALQDQSYLYQCGVGFSGVLFALKVVTTHMMPRGTQYIMGWIPVNSRYACWVELVVIHIMVPNSSFMGHLAGIIVGLAYVKGPLKTIMDIPASMFTGMGSGPSYTYQSGTAGYNDQQWGGASGRTNRPDVRRPQPGRSNYGGGASSGNPPSYGWAPHTQNNGHVDGGHAGYTGGLSEEEQMARAMRDSMNDYYNNAPPEPSAPSAPNAPPPAYSPSAPPPAYEDIDHHDRIPPTRQGGIYPDLGAVNAEEVRRRRLQHFK